MSNDTGFNVHFTPEHTRKNNANIRNKKLKVKIRTTKKNGWNAMLPILFFLTKIHKVFV